METLNFCPFEIFEENKTKYIYVNNTNGLFEIDNVTLELLKQNGKSVDEAYENMKDMISYDDFNKTVENMRKYKFIVTEDSKKESEEYMFNRSVSAITLFVIQDCNLRCTYCYGDGGQYCDHGKMSIETVKKAVDFLVEQSETNNLDIAFFGGEPLLNMPLIKYVIKYTKQIEEKSNKRFSFCMTTNGTLLTPEIEKYLIDNKVSIQISFDGDKKVQDKNRFFANGKGSYDLVVEKTKNLRDKKQISCRGTITSVSLNLKESFEHLYELGFRSIMLSPADNLLTDEDYVILTNEFIKLIHVFEKLIDEGNYETAMKMKEKKS